MKNFCIRAKKGSAIVEAAMVLPIVILTVVTLIYLLIDLYGATVMNAAQHTALRQEAGVQTETACLTDIEEMIPADRYGSKAWREKIEIYDKGILSEKYLYTESEKNIKGGGLTDHFVKKTFYGRCYLVDEVEYIRWVDLIKKDRRQSSSP